MNRKILFIKLYNCIHANILNLVNTNDEIQSIYIVPVYCWYTFYFVVCACIRLYIIIYFNLVILAVRLTMINWTHIQMGYYILLSIFLVFCWCINVDIQLYKTHTSYFGMCFCRICQHLETIRHMFVFNFIAFSFNLFIFAYSSSPFKLL